MKLVTQTGSYHQDAAVWQIFQVPGGAGESPEGEPSSSGEGGRREKTGKYIRDIDGYNYNRRRVRYRNESVVFTGESPGGRVEAPGEHHGTVGGGRHGAAERHRAGPAEPGDVQLRPPPPPPQELPQGRF